MLNRETEKLYYSNPYLTSCVARVVRIGQDYIELDKTIAFPEGGGQEADHGEITAGDLSIRFVHAKKMYGMPAHLPDFPDITVGGVIWHMVTPEDQPQLKELKQGQEVIVKIDAVRRAWLALSHTASHLVYLGIGVHRPDAIGATLGCHIKTHAARFDFSVAERFQMEEIAAISTTANALITRRLPIEVFSDRKYPDARYWRCDGQTIPCGGLHLSITTPIVELTVRRKSLGAGKERISCEFPQATIDLANYDQDNHANASSLR